VFLRAILRLIRPSSSILGGLAIFVALLGRTRNLGISFGKAIPLFFIAVCTFVANDLDDLERDRVNHPERPLPAGHLTPGVAAVLYFVSLVLALFSTRHFVAQDIAFWYYGLFILSISYGYVVECLPSLKAPYVAAATSVPVLIVARSYPDEPRLYVIAVCVFLFTLGREICGVILDRLGDPISYLHSFEPASLALVSFIVQVAGLLLLATQIRAQGETACLLAMTLLLALAGVYWFKSERYRRATLLMKIQLFIGLYFLV
jgi:geranylgeranylglycerol-phosphate geranylgeranyltransferase